MATHSIFAGTKTWKKRDPGLPPTSQAKWNHANAEKLKAHAMVRRALRDGTLKRGKCEVCGSFRTEGHHPDYTVPLVVTWLCRRHHRELHAAMRGVA